METTLKIDASKFEAALVAFMVQSKKTIHEVVAQQMKGVITKAVSITPPGHSVQTSAGNRLVIGSAAKKAGEATVNRDIRSMYGTPSQCYDEIKAIAPPVADAFWKLHKAGDQTGARAIAREKLGTGYAPFDTGEVHRRLNGKRRPRPARRRVYFVDDEKALSDYIKQQQRHVFWLAAGWAAAARAFGVNLPQMITRHNAPGSVHIEVNDQRILLRATNAVTYARGIADMERRVQWAVDSQTRAMEKILLNNIHRAAKRAGLMVTGAVAA